MQISFIKEATKEATKEEEEDSEDESVIAGGQNEDFDMDAAIDEAMDKLEQIDYVTIGKIVIFAVIFMSKMASSPCVSR